MKTVSHSTEQAGAYNLCDLCPRKCGVNRSEGFTGFCKETAELKIASACLHFGEEPPLTAKGGSGTVFISGCNLGCSFCQNYQISRQGMGKIVEKHEFVRICRALEQAGAENINIVTGSHAIPAIAEGLTQAKKEGLSIPICWNSSAYESIQAINMLSGLVDIWLPDFKVFDSRTSKALFGLSNYGKAVQKTIRRMIELAPLKFEPWRRQDAKKKSNQNTAKKSLENPLSKLKEEAEEYNEKIISGVIVRHLILPDCIDQTVKILNWLKEYADGKACISIMSQYTPVPENPKQRVFPDRFIDKEEFDYIKHLICKYEFECLFYQEPENDDSWLPDFNRIQPFSNTLAKPVWHWKNGFTNHAL